MGIREDRPRGSVRSPLAFLAFLGLAFGAAATGALFEPGEWYRELAKPPWTPPDAVFGPVWTLLYLTIAVAGWLLWRRRELPAARLALGLWGLQLVLNAAWSWIFFGLHRPGAALVEIGLLLGTVAATLAAAARVRPGVALLLAPYAAWVAFAAALNFAIWRLATAS